MVSMNQTRKKMFELIFNSIEDLKSLKFKNIGDLNEQSKRPNDINSLKIQLRKKIIISKSKAYLMNSFYKDCNCERSIASLLVHVVSQQHEGIWHKFVYCIVRWFKERKDEHELIRLRHFLFSLYIYIYHWKINVGTNTLGVDENLLLIHILT